MGGARAAAAPEARALAAALGDRANELAAAGRGAEVPALWEDAIARIGDEELRDRIMLAYAWYQALHGEAAHGVTLAAALRDSTVGAVRIQVRTLLRNRWRAEPDLVAATWETATGSALPGWTELPEETVRAVADWVSAGAWAASELWFGERIAGLPAADVDAALEELLLGGGDGVRAAVGVHRAILALGSPAYQSLASVELAAETASTAAVARDWETLQAIGTLEVLALGRRFLGSVHVIAAEAMMSAGTVDARLLDRVAALAGSASAAERARARADILAIGDAAVAGLGGAGPEA